MKIMSMALMVMSLYGGAVAAGRTTKLTILQRMGDSRNGASSCDAASATYAGWQANASVPVCPLSESWKGVAAAGLLAVEHFNARNAAFVPALAQEPFASCTDQIEATVVDSGSEGVPATKNFLAAYYNAATKPHAVVGPARSISCISSAVTAGILDVPQLSYWATSNALDDTTTFSRFGRTIPDDAMLAESLVQFMGTNGKIQELRGTPWAKVGMIYVNDAWGSNWKTQIMLHAKDYGINIEARLYNIADNKFEAQLDELHALGLNVIICMSFSPSQNMIIEYATKIGLLGPGKLWIFGDGLSETDLKVRTATCTNNCLTQKAQDAMPGNMRIVGAGGLPSNPNWNAWTTAWSGFHTTPGAAALNAKLPDYFKLKSDFFQTHPVDTAIADIGAFEYDAVMTFAMQGCLMSDAEHANFGTSFWNAKETFGDHNVTGLTGHIKYSAVGNRHKDTVNVAITSAAKHATTPAGPMLLNPAYNYNAETKKWVLAAGVASEESIKWGPGAGSNTPPIDVTPELEAEDSGSIIQYVLLPCGFIVALGLAAVVASKSDVAAAMLAKLLQRSMIIVLSLTLELTDIVSDFIVLSLILRTDSFSKYLPYYSLFLGTGMLVFVLHILINGLYLIRLLTYKEFKTMGTAEVSKAMQDLIQEYMTAKYNAEVKAFSAFFWQQTMDADHAAVADRIKDTVRRHSEGDLSGPSKDIEATSPATKKDRRPSLAFDGTTGELLSLDELQRKALDLNRDAKIAKSFANRTMGIIGLLVFEDIPMSVINIAMLVGLVSEAADPDSGAVLQETTIVLVLVSLLVGTLLMGVKFAAVGSVNQVHAKYHEAYRLRNKCIDDIIRQLATDAGFEAIPAASSSDFTMYTAKPIDWLVKKHGKSAVVPAPLTPTSK